MQNLNLDPPIRRLAYFAKTTMQVKNKLKMPTDTNLTWIVVANADDLRRKRCQQAAA